MPAVFQILIGSVVNYCMAAELNSEIATKPGASREVHFGENALTRAAPVPIWVDNTITAPPTSPTTQYPLIIRLSDHQIYLDKEKTVFSHRMLQANEASMLSTVGQIEIAFQPEYQRVELHFLQIIRDSKVIDKTITADIRFLQREQELESGIYTGAVTASIVIEDIRVGDTVNIGYSIVGQNPVFGGNFFHASYWDGIFPIQRTRLSLNTPETRTIYSRVIGRHLGDIPAQEQRLGGRKILRFGADNLAAIDFEPHTPSDIDQFRQIQFSEFKSWQQVAQWASTLFDVSARNDSLDGVLATIGDVANEDEATQKALDYVQTKIRYLSVSLGENSHKPFTPDVVLARRYGDCKDKTLFLVTLLKRLGIEASPVLISATNQKGPGKLLPSPLAFDHAIVRAIVNGKVYYLDPTRSAQVGSLANLGQAYPGAEVLIIENDSNKLATISPATASTQVVNTRSEKVSLKKIDGTADMLAVIRYSGLNAEAARFYINRQTPSQLRKNYMASIMRQYQSAELIGNPVIADNKFNNTIEVEMHFRIPHFLEKTSSGWLLHYHPSNLREQFYIPDNPRRHHPLAIPSQLSTSRYDFEINLPEEVNAEYKPSETFLKNLAFSAKESLSFKGHVFHASLELKILDDRVAPKDIATFISDTKKFAKTLDGSLALGSSDFKTNASAALLDTPLKTRLAQQQEESIAATSSIITEAKSNGASTADTLCERAQSYARLGKKTDALADIADALKERPNSTELLRCRAEVNFFVGEMKSSEAYFSHIIGLGIKDGAVYFERGMANYATGKWRDAENDFSQASASYNDRKDKIRADIMLALAHRRAYPLNRNTTQNVSQEEWPNIVIDAINGSKTHDDVLRLVHQHIGDELELALSDAYFYLAQLDILAGNKLKAIVLLQRSVDKGILTSVYRQTARIEAERLRR